MHTLLVTRKRSWKQPPKNFCKIPLYLTMAVHGRNVLGVKRFQSAGGERSGNDCWRALEGERARDSQGNLRMTDKERLVRCYVETFLFSFSPALLPASFS